MTHPIRDAELHVFKRIEGMSGVARYIARFHPYDNWPVFFKGATAEEARNKAKEFRDECIEKHEADIIRRKEQAAKMKKAKEKSQ